MSHFTVLVLGDNIESQLEPYFEGEEVETYWRDQDSVEEFAKLHGVEPINSLKFIKDKQKALEAAVNMKIKEYAEDEGRAWRINNGRVESESNYNPKSKWDWYEIGGRWSGFFTLKDGSKSDQAKKSEIDFEAMEANEEKEAREYHKKVREAFGGEIPVVEVTWDEVLADDSIGDIEAKRAYYHSQPAMKLKAKAEKKNPDLFGWGFSLEYINPDEDEYANKIKAKAYSTYAVLAGGEWYEKGKMGMFGMSDDKMTEEEWLSSLKKLVEDASDDTLFTLVDCHI